MTDHETELVEKIYSMRRIHYEDCRGYEDLVTDHSSDEYVNEILRRGQVFKMKIKNWFYGLSDEDQMLLVKISIVNAAVHWDTHEHWTDEQQSYYRLIS